MSSSPENIGKNVESSQERSSVMERAKKLESSKEFNDASGEVANSAAEALGAVEPMGRVSEIIGEARENANDGDLGSGGKGDDDSGSSVAGSGSTIDPEELKKRLLANLPTEKMMKKEIEREIKKEIKYLHKKAMKMLRSPDVSYFEMNNVVSKIRELKGILSTLLKASVDGVKTLWLRYVHGIMQ